MGAKEVIRFDLLAMTGGFILIFFFRLFQTSSMIWRFFIRIRVSAFQGKEKTPKKGGHVYYDEHARFKYQISNFILQPCSFLCVIERVVYQYQFLPVVFLVQMP